jgi:hypothetical protein
MRPSSRRPYVVLNFDLRMLLGFLDCGSGVGAVRYPKCVQICEALFVWPGVSVVQLKFGGSYFRVPGRHSPIARPCQGPLRLQIYEFEVDALVGPWDDELRFDVGS